VSATERKTVSATKPSSQASSSRPVTPAPPGAPQRTISPTDTKTGQKKERAQTQLPPSPSPSIHPEPEEVSGSQGEDAVPSDVQQESTDLAQSPALPTATAPLGFPAAPPGLAAPLGMPPGRPPRVQTASPQTPLLASQSSYQMSTAARALLDDVKARRESAFSTATGVSPFPDFDRTLQTLSREDGGGFSFNLDPALAGEDVDQALPDFEVEANTPFHGSYVEAFPALRPFGPSPTAFNAPPGLPFPHPSSRSIYDPLAIRPLPISALQKQPSGGSPSYMGSFDPFAEAGEVSQAVASSVHQQSFLDDDPSRKVSRFGFARGRQAAASTPSPLPPSSQLSNTNSDNQSFANSADGISGTLAPTPWSIRDRGDYGFQSSSAMELSLMQHTQSDLLYPQQQTLSQALDSGLSEAQLRDFIQSSREKVTSTVHQNGLTGMPYIYIAAYIWYK
jgi:CCR4-NOT transcription complex subunit 4